MGRAILAIAACTVACAHALEPLKPAIKPWQRATPNALTAARLKLRQAPLAAAQLAQSCDQQAGHYRGRQDQRGPDVGRIAAHIEESRNLLHRTFQPA